MALTIFPVNVHQAWVEACYRVGERSMEQLEMPFHGFSKKESNTADWPQAPYLPGMV